MAGLGVYIKNGLNLLGKLSDKKFEPVKMQERELRKMLKKAKSTAFGTTYDFQGILNNQNSINLCQGFKQSVPIYTYNEINKSWWKKAREGEEDVCWPGKVKFFATSSGTSEASSKYIPVTDEMIEAIQKTGIRQLLTLPQYELPVDVYETEVLMLGGCSNLIDKGCYMEGDLSGIQVSRLPHWFKGFYRPGKEISNIRDWPEKLDAIARNAHKWNVGVIMGVPAWNQIMIEKIINYHKVKNIHELWPNLRIFVHGGVSIDPYIQGFEKLFSKPVTFIETYLASEGFLAYQSAPGKKEMKLVLDNGIFYEFIPFDESNFDENWEPRQNAQTLTIGEVEEGREYALLISTCSGTWRYLIGDVVKITSKESCEILITGRTKHFLSMCGEHLSVENMNEAIKHVSNELKIDIREFTVAGIPHNNLFAHKWFIGTDNQVSKEQLEKVLDRKLKELNRDYEVKRQVTLQEIFVEVLPSEIFYKWHRSEGREGGQNKFPRVLKGPKLDQWQKFVQKEIVHYHKSSVSL